MWKSQPDFIENFRFPHHLPYRDAHAKRAANAFSLFNRAGVDTFHLIHTEYETSRHLFSDKKIDVINPEWSEFPVGALEIEQQSTKGNKNFTAQKFS